MERLLSAGRGVERAVADVSDVHQIQFTPKRAKRDSDSVDIEKLISEVDRVLTGVTEWVSHSLNDALNDKALACKGLRQDLQTRDQ